MGTFVNMVLFVSSLFIIGLGVFILKYNNQRENIESYFKIVASLCIFLGVMGLLLIGILEFF